MPPLQDILATPALNGVYRLNRPLDTLPDNLVPVLDARTLADPAELLAALGPALDLPDYYGANWDALEECLNDLSWRAGPLWLVLKHTEAMPTALLAILIDIFADAAAYWADEGRGCSLFLEGLARADLPTAD